MRAPRDSAKLPRHNLPAELTSFVGRRIRLHDPISEALMV
jgi:hypothetical protein